jgi:heptaprenyl diphosphate synthase
MTASVIKLAVTAQDRRLARYATAAIVLGFAEAALPSPLPGVKPGLANIIVLIALWRHGWGAAVWVALLRVFAGSLLLGQLLAPGFFLSLAGALTSLAALGVMVPVFRRGCGPVSASLIAAFAHMAGQLALARVWLIPHDALWQLTPVFAAAALGFGLINGLIAARFIAENPLPETLTP